MDTYNKLKEKLIDKKIPDNEIEQYMLYLVNAQREEEQRQKKDPKKGLGAVRSNSIDTLYSLFTKYRKMGLPIDGTNVVITGKNMAMVTYNGYKNKVKQSYPSATFDVQLVREGDEFKFSKKDGRMTYTHDFGNPFQDNPIIGAYCIIEIGEKQYFESLNTADFGKMKDTSRQKYLWGQWASEFWLKSVLKRACKRHFYDEVKEIDKNDNDDYGVDEEKSNKQSEYSEEQVKLFENAKDIDELKSLWKETDKADPLIYAAKEKRKKELIEIQEKNKESE